MGEQCGNSTTTHIIRGTVGMDVFIYYDIPKIVSETDGLAGREIFYLFRLEKE